jgi:hypothetical protein
VDVRDVAEHRDPRQQRHDTSGQTSFGGTGFRVGDDLVGVPWAAAKPP